MFCQSTSCRSGYPSRRGARLLDHDRPASGSSRGKRWVDHREWTLQPKSARQCIDSTATARAGGGPSRSDPRDRVRHRRDHPGVIGVVIFGVLGVVGVAWSPARLQLPVGAVLALVGLAISGAYFITRGRGCAARWDEGPRSAGREHRDGPRSRPSRPFAAGSPSCTRSPSPRRSTVPLIGIVIALAALAGSSSCLNDVEEPTSRAGLTLSPTRSSSRRRASPADSNPAS